MKRKRVLVLITVMAIFSSSQNVLAGKDVLLDSISKLKEETTEEYTAEESAAEESAAEEITLMNIDANTMTADVNGTEYVFHVTETELYNNAKIIVSYEACNPRGDRQYRIDLRLDQDIEPGEYKAHEIGMEFYTDYYEKNGKYQWNKKHYCNYDSENVANSVLVSYRDDKWEHYQGALSVEFDDGYVVENAVFDFRLNDEYGTVENSDDSDNNNTGLQDLIKGLQ